MIEDQRYASCARPPRRLGLLVLADSLAFLLGLRFLRALLLAGGSPADLEGRGAEDMSLFKFFKPSALWLFNAGLRRVRELRGLRSSAG